MPRWMNVKDWKPPCDRHRAGEVYGVIQCIGPTRRTQTYHPGPPFAHSGKRVLRENVDGEAPNSESAVHTELRTGRT